jgi:pyruvate-formate lyase-activating enzyme
VARQRHIAVSARPELVSAVVADARGRIIDLPGYAAVGRAGDRLVPLRAADTLRMPHGGEVMMLPGRLPLVLNRQSGAIEALRVNPYTPAEPVFAVAAFNSPGYALALTSAFEELPAARALPLFSYGAVGWHQGGFHSALIQVDREPRQDLRHMPLSRVRAGIGHMRRLLPDNRLRQHLERCALTYGCPAGKNFFLGRYEAPLPTSRVCNARCLGCLSLQPEDGPIPCSQQRIAFTPEPEEIAGVALAHIERVERAIVSFGQGCEGDPLLAAEVVAAAIRRIRRTTRRGTINLNTNGSLPVVLDTLLRAGLDSVRVSLNSVRPSAYTAYFRPAGYAFTDVLTSIERALAHGVFVSLNYLHMPGFNDTAEEIEALMDFLSRRPVHMIQWRNLNYDPLRYLASMSSVTPPGRSLGMHRLLERIHREFPGLRFGYFNPPRESFAGARRRRRAGKCDALD